jgi:uncharacterized protein (DUF58 family)
VKAPKAQLVTLWFLVVVLAFNIATVDKPWRGWSYLLNGVPLLLLLLAALGGAASSAIVEVNVKPPEPPCEPPSYSDKRTSSN